MSSGTVWHGEFWTRSLCEYPNGTVTETSSDGSVRSHSAAGVSFLSDILETCVPQRYCLSPKACAGILRRAEKRGKPLPPMLDAALKAQGGVGAVGFVQNQHDKVRLMGGDGSICGALAAQPGAKGQTFVADPTTCLTPWDGQAQRVYSSDGIFPTL